MADQVRVTYNGASLNAMLVANAAGSGTSADQVQGNAASAATDSGNPVKIGGYGNATAPTAVTAGQRVNAWYALNGASMTVVTDKLGNISNCQVPLDAMNGTTGLAVSSQNQSFNGTSWDRLRKPNVFARAAASAASGNPAVLKASAGDLMQFWGVNTQAALRYLQLYNKASAPVLGTDVPVLTYPIPASGQFSTQIPNGGAYFATGIAFAITTDAAGATGAAAGDVTALSLLAA